MQPESTSVNPEEDTGIDFDHLESLLEEALDRADDFVNEYSAEDTPDIPRWKMDEEGAAEDGFYAVCGLQEKIRECLKAVRQASGQNDT